MTSNVHHFDLNWPPPKRAFLIDRDKPSLLSGIGLVLVFHDGDSLRGAHVLSKGGWTIECTFLRGARGCNGGIHGSIRCNLSQSRSFTLYVVSNHWEERFGSTGCLRPSSSGLQGKQLMALRLNVGVVALVMVHWTMKSLGKKKMNNTYLFKVSLWTGYLWPKNVEQINRYFIQLFIL